MLNNIKIISKQNNTIILEFPDGMEITDEEMIRVASDNIEDASGSVKFLKCKNDLAYFQVTLYKK